MTRKSTFFFLVIILLGIFYIGTEEVYAQGYPLETDIGGISPENASSIAKEDQRAIGYQFFIKLMDILRDFLQNLYTEFAEHASMLILLMTTVAVAMYAFGMLTGKSIPLFEVCKFVLTVIVINSMIIDWDFFHAWIYKPMINIMTGIPSFAIEVTSNIKVVQGTSALHSMFKTVDASIANIIEVGQNIVDNKGWLDSFLLFFYGLGLQVIFFVLQVVFSYVFLLAFWSLHMLLAVLPFVLAFAVFAPTRKYLKNVISHSLTFLITPTMAAFSMSITLYFVQDVSDELVASFSGDSFEGADIYLILQAFFIGIVSIFFHLKATSFAAQVIGTADTGFGQVFGSTLAIATGAAKLSAGIAKNAGIGAAKGAFNSDSSMFSGGISHGVGHVAGRITKSTVTGAGQSASYLYGNIRNPDKN